VRKSIDFANVPSPDEDLPDMAWIVGAADIFDDGAARVFVVLEEQGRAGYGQSVYLTPDEARRLAAALRSALREIGAAPG
jgi:hypothetical protein